MVPSQESDATMLTLTRVATAPVLIAEIAKSSGKRLEVSPALRTEILMVSVDKMRVSDVLSKIAIAATANWEPMDGGYRLVPDVSARNVEAVAERARRLQAINEGIRKKAVEAAKAKGEEAPGAAMAAMFTGGKSTDPFVPMLDTYALASMEAGDRLVFSTNPTPMQRPLRGNANAVVARWIEEHNRQAKAMAGNLGQMPSEMDSLMSTPIGDRLRRASRMVLAAPAKVVVVASKGAIPFFGIGGSDIRLEVRAYGADGSILVEETGNIGSDFNAFLQALQPKPPAPAGEKVIPIVYSEEAKALQGMTLSNGLSIGSGMAARPQVTPKLRAILLAPERRDPLGLIPGEGLVALAAARRKPLVGAIPDAAFAAIIGTSIPKTVEDVEESLRTGPMRLVPDAAFLVVKAADPDNARRNRVGRSALGTFLRAADDHEVPTLDELANFALSSPDPALNPLVSTMLGLFDPGSMGSMRGLTSWDSLRLYASLTAGQRTGLASGGQVPFNTLSPSGKAALSSMLYGAGNSLTIERPGTSEDLDLISLGMKMTMGGGGIDSRDEPTESVPHGLPAGGYLQAKVETEPIIRPITPDGPSPSVLGTDELALVGMIKASPMGQQAEEAMRLPDSGRMGTRTSWMLKGFVANGAYVTATLNDDRTPKDGATVNMNSLPADLQSRISEKEEKLKNSALGKMMAIGAAQVKRRP